MKFHLSLLSLGIAVSPVAAQDDTIYSDCAADSYYSSLSGASDTWTRDQVRSLLTTTHRTILPEFPTSDNPEDITAALIDLWPGRTNPEDNIQLIYRSTEMPSRPANGLESWTKESFWPVERGAVRGTPIATDVHQTAPGDWTVLEDKDRLNPVWHVFYGECGTVNSIEACVSPANSETASDTAQDGKIYQPPADVRGDIARALFYDAIRYESDGLSLVDCPPFADKDYGYRSMLLQWHLDDPVSQEEMTRNDRACSRWQGNRNVFVDYPDLVTQFFGEADTIPTGMMQFSSCVTPTDSPTATPNECSAIIPGGINMYALNSDDPDQIVFFPVENIPGSVGSLFVTDNAWTGTGFTDEEGTLELKLPEEGIEAGQVFGYNTKFATDVGEWSIVDSSLFSLNPSGDNILLYCINADDEPHFISALSYGGQWLPAGQASYSTKESALPERLMEAGSVAFEGYPNWLYNGTQESSRDVLIPAFSDPNNWAGSSLRYQISGAPNRIMVASTSVALSLISYLFW